ncbi:MAG: ABC transporter ATP-binding protein [Acidobacteriaceae bacterium]|nr:ABC transporter ATP-binding protein [Acidobacteriaceae bacterium]
MNSILEFNEVTRAYKKGIPVLKGVSFSLGAGEVVGLLGPNGAGKTTLIRIAMGMLYPDSGWVRVFGLAPTEKPVEVKRGIGYVAEDQILPGSASIGEIVSLHRYLFPAWDAELERDLMDRFGLSPRQKIRALSKGQARQAALLCAVCHRPELLILDEPAGGLDPAARREFLEASIQLLNREGTTILFSSHYMGDVERIGGRIVLLDEGSVRLDTALDHAREDLCLAIVPLASAPEHAALEQVPGCLRTRRVFADWHAVFEGSPETVQLRLRQSLGMNGIRCVRLPLEELFVELVGGKRERKTL